jgi:hypothetical protein
LGDELLAVDEQGSTHRWTSENRTGCPGTWEPVFVQGGGGSRGELLGPIPDESERLLLAARGSGRGWLRSGQALLVGRAADGWAPDDGPALPEGTFELLPDPRGRLLAVTNRGIHRFAGDLGGAPEKLELFFMEIPLTMGRPFRSAGPAEPLQITPPAAAAIDARTATVAIYSRGTIMLLEREGDDYQLARTVNVEAEPDQGATVALGGSTLLLALADGRILDYELSSLRLRRQWRPEAASQPRFAGAAPDGRWFAVVFHNGRLHLLDSEAELRLAPVGGQKDITAARFSGDDTLLVADRARRVTRYRLDSWERADVFAPPLTAMEIAYYYAIVPLYTLFPKPGELDNTIQYVVSGQETMDMGMQAGDLQAKRVRLRPWAPVRSSLAFMSVMLVLACIYIERQDF